MPLKLLLYLIFILCLPGRHAWSQTFQNNESLKFKIRWGLVPAGEVTLTVQLPTKINGIPANHFTLKAKTYPIVDLIYKLRQQIDSYTTLNVERSLLYKESKSGKSRREIVVNFDWQNGMAQYSNFGRQREPVKLLPGTIDPLSALYFIRQQKFSLNNPIKRPVTDGKKVVMGNVTILGRETITCYGTSYDTYKLEPDMKDVRGVFKKSKNAKMFIWITADDRKLLVKLKSKVVVGSFVAELIEVKRAI